MGGAKTHRGAWPSVHVAPKHHFIFGSSCLQNLANLSIFLLHIVWIVKSFIGGRTLPQTETKWKNKSQITFRFGFSSHWPAVLFLGLEIIGKKYDLYLHRNAIYTQNQKYTNMKTWSLQAKCLRDKVTGNPEESWIILSPSHLNFLSVKWKTTK